MAEFNLRALVKDVAASSLSPDPGVIAEEVDRRIGSRDCRAALRAALRGYVRTVITEQRRATDIVPLVAGGGTTGRPAKWKTREARAWQLALRDKIHVGGNVWKFRGECTIADLLSAAAINDKNAAENRAQGRANRELARIMGEQGVERVKELRPEILSRVLVSAS